MSKLFRLMIAVGLIAVMLMALNGALVWAASPPYPTYDTATVDGTVGASEWDTDCTDGPCDFFADMYESADSLKDVLSKLYLRYDCDNNILYALVLVESGHTIDVDADSTPGEEHFIKINGSQIVSDGDRPPAGGPPDFEWIGLGGGGTTADGWEASASLDPGTYNDFDVHTQVDADQTSAVEGRQIDLLIDCTCNSEIGDYVWHDADEEGDQDELDAGIPNISVALRDANSDLVDLQITDPNGLYLFTNLCIGTYTVDVDENDEDMGAFFYPSLYKLTTDNEPMAVNLTGTSYYDADFGYAAYETTLGAIGDLVWHDEDESGYQNGNEPGIPDTTLTLYKWGSWTQWDTTDTDYFGNYMFWDLEAGIYKVDVDENDVTAWFSPDDWSQTTDFEPMCVELGTTSQRVDCGSVGSGSPAGGGGIRVLGTDVEDFLDADFGYLSEGSATAVTFSSFAARSSVGGLASGLWPGLLGLTMLAAGSLFWAKRQARSVK